MSSSFAPETIFCRNVTVTLARLRTSTRTFSGRSCTSVASAWTSGSLLDRPFRSVHRVSAYVLGALTALVALTQGPWDALFDWLADVPLPVVLVMVGSALLIGVGLVVRTAVNRLSDGSR